MLCYNDPLAISWCSSNAVMTSFCMRYKALANVVNIKVVKLPGTGFNFQLPVTDLPTCFFT